MTNQTKNSMLLMLCALIWGTAFVAQSAGSGMGAFSFLAGRSWMAVLVLIPTVKAFDALHHRQGRPDGKPKTAAERKLLLKAGLVCGTLLFLASAAQQLGITLDEQAIEKLAWMCTFEGRRTIGSFKVLGLEEIKDIYRAAR